MAPVPASIQDSVLVALRTAKEEGVRQVSKTALVKLVYLLDCLHAESHEGRTVSGSDWYFHKFGPFATNLMSGLEEMAQRGVVNIYEGEKGDKDYTLFSVTDYYRGPSLEDLGLSSAMASRFAQMTRKLAGDLAKLLDYTYFKTLPMQQAKPGQALHFGALADMAADAPLRRARVEDHALIKRLAERAHRFHERGNARRAGLAEAWAAHNPIYDGEFARAMQGETPVEGVYPVDMEFVGDRD